MVRWERKIMKNIFVSLFIAILFMGTAGIKANAAILNFDDINQATIHFIPDGYGGFHWKDLYVYFSNGEIISRQSSPFSNVYNWSGHEGVITADTPFNFIGTNLATMITSDFNASGYLNNQLLWSKTNFISSSQPSTRYDFNFNGIDKLVLNNGNQFYMDDFEYTKYTSVPEPSTMLLLGFGLVGLIGVRKRFQP